MNEEQSFWRIIGVLFFLSLGLNLAWENLHATLYTGVAGIVTVLPFYLVSTLGDAASTVLLYALVAIVVQDKKWIRRMTAARMLWIGAIGCAGAVVVEKIALSTSLWHYTSHMPLVPGVGVGLSPVAQMTVLPALTIFLGAFFLKPTQFQEMSPKID